MRKLYQNIPEFQLYKINERKKERKKERKEERPCVLK